MTGSLRLPDRGKPLHDLGEAPARMVATDRVRRHNPQPGTDPAVLFKDAVCVTTMMPCPMCAGAIIRFGFAKVVVAETESYVDAGTTPLMERQGLTVEVGREQSCIDLVELYYERDPEMRKLMRSGARPKLVMD